MRAKRLLGVLLLALSATANAAPAPQLNVYSTGVATVGARVLGVSYLKSVRSGWENGPNVVHTSGTDGRIVGLIKGGAPADVVIVQTSEMAELEKAGLIKAGTAHPLGRVDIGVMVKKGKPHPDISTYPKFRDALLAAGAVGYTDPKSGSAGGILIDKILDKPEFANLKRVYRPQLTDEVPIALEAMGQLRTIYGVDFIGKVPESLNAHLDFSIGVFEKSSSPKEALAFEQFVLAKNAASDLGQVGGGAVNMRHKTRMVIATALMLLATAGAQAQVTFTTPNDEAARAPRPQRERGPALAPAILAAQTAVEACHAMGYQVTAVVVNSAAMPVVILSGDGAPVITQSIAMGKAVSSVRNGMATSDLIAASKADPALAAKLAADPQQGTQRPGGLPIKVGADVIGAIAVSGAPDGNWDAECGQAGLNKVTATPKRR